MVRSFPRKCIRWDVWKHRVRSPTLVHAGCVTDDTIPDPNDWTKNKIPVNEWNPPILNDSKRDPWKISHPATQRSWKPYPDSIRNKFSIFESCCCRVESLWQNKISIKSILNKRSFIWLTRASILNMPFNTSPLLFSDIDRSMFSFMM